MQCTDSHIQQVKELCKQQGLRLTPIRELVLRLLLEADRPLSAYELLERFTAANQRKAQPMTIYRALNFLEACSMIHKLASTRQYVACNHLHEPHHSELTQFLICDECGHIDENPLPGSLCKSIQQNAKQSHFKIAQPNIEIHGTCEQCQNDETTK